MRSIFEMEKIINRDRALCRKKQIENVKYDIENSNYYNTVGSPLPKSERIRYNIEVGRTFLKSK